MPDQSTRRFPPPWTVEEIPGGYKVKDANGKSLAYVYGRETRADADIAKVLTMDEARRIASNIAKLRTTSRLILKCTIEHEREVPFIQSATPLTALVVCGVRYPPTQWQCSAHPRSW